VEEKPIFSDTKLTLEKQEILLKDYMKTETVTRAYIK
jgi:hypothetical protein